MNRLGFTDREAAFLSMGEFIDLYQEYKDMFDRENMLRMARTTYERIERKAAAEKEVIIEF